MSFPDPIFPGERFDEHASDLDSWRADQERLRVLEESAHARIDRAALRMVSGPGPYASALDLPGSPADCVDLLPERSAARDAWTLDRLAELLHSDTRPWGLELEREAIELIRSTGRTC